MHIIWVLSLHFGPIAIMVIRYGVVIGYYIVVSLAARSKAGPAAKFER